MKQIGNEKKIITEKRVWEAASGLQNIAVLLVMITGLGISWGAIQATDTAQTKDIDLIAQQVKQLGDTQNKIVTNVAVIRVIVQRIDRTVGSDPIGNDQFLKQPQELAGNSDK